MNATTWKAVRLIVWVFAVALGSVLADDKLDDAAWNYMRTLVPGQDIRVELKDGKTKKGKIQLLTEDGIVLRIGKKDTKFKRESIRRVLARGESHHGNNAAIGAIVGGLAGAGVGAAIPSGGWVEVYRATEAATPLPGRQPDPHDESL